MKREEEKKKKMKGKGALLAPAGSPAAYIAAVENGADAVYLGGKIFNARIHAGNFDQKELEDAIDYGHLRGVKSYVTMNTLLRDDQMAQAMEYVRFLYQIGADGIILQDLGLGYLIKQTLPELPLHLSTQGTIYDRRGVEAAASLGYERVVLARELSLKEIREITEQTETEIEVFVHGALCFCYSGQCQLSRFIGGRSGNQGECAQPCRLPYRYRKSGEKSGPAAYLLSPRDLCLIEELGELAEAGVHSFKIEGRMKSPEYVAIVTSIYRKYLDLYREKGRYTVSREDWEQLHQIFNRGGFTKAYFYRDPEEDLLCPGLPKHQGIRIGRVLSSQKRTERRQGKQKGNERNPWLVDLRMDHGGADLQLGDGIEFHGRKLTGNVITYQKQIEPGVERIGDFPEEPAPGTPVYRLTSRALMEQAEKTFRGLTFSEGKFRRRTGVRGIFRCERGKAASLEITWPVSFLAEEETAFGQIPVKRPTTEDEIRKQLGKTGGTPFFMEEIAVKVTEPVSISLAGLNQLRRKALQQLEEILRRQSKRSLPENTAGEIRRAEENRSADSSGELLRKDPWPGKERVPERQFYFYEYKTFMETAVPKTPGWNTICLIDAEDLLENFDAIKEREKAEEIQVCPYIPAVIRGKEDWLERHFEELVSLLKGDALSRRPRRIFIGNLNWISSFAGEGVPVSGNPELNIYNSYCMAAYRSLGLTESFSSLEDGETIGGWIPLMVTEHMMLPGQIEDRKKEKFFCLDSKRYHKSYLLGYKENVFAEEKSTSTKPSREPQNLCSETKKTIRIYVKDNDLRSHASL